MKKLMPKCLGRYGKIPECDGDSTGETDEEKMPCTFRDRCVALVWSARDREVKPSELIQLYKKGKVKYIVASGDDEELQLGLAQAIKKYGIRGGVVTNRSGKPLPEAARKKKKRKADRPESRAKSNAALPAARAAGAVAAKDKAARTKVGMLEKVAWFTKQLEEKSARPISTDMAELPVGGILLVDRTETSNYIGLYGKPVSGGKLPLATVTLKTRSEDLQIRLALEVDKFAGLLSKDSKKKATPELVLHDGAFKSRVNRADREMATIVAEAIASGIAAGLFGLPDLE